jgi:hypothetical protein
VITDDICIVKLIDEGKRERIDRNNCEIMKMPIELIATIMNLKAICTSLRASNGILCYGESLMDIVGESREIMCFALNESEPLSVLWFPSIRSNNFEVNVDLGEFSIPTDCRTVIR